MGPPHSGLYCCLMATYNSTSDTSRVLSRDFHKFHRFSQCVHMLQPMMLSVNGDDFPKCVHACPIGSCVVNLGVIATCGSMWE